ncbi:MBL fold metallo-hydrolase [bacterium]|nr:MBL fold metallo-hydrolase [bacterium]
MPRRQTPRIIALAALALVALSLYGCCPFSADGYRGPVSEHFDGERFHNEVTYEGRFFDFLRWITNRDKGDWPDWIDAKPGPPPARRVDGGRLVVTFINHATLLVQMDGLNILTDPVWSDRVSPLSFAGPKRHRPPGIRFEDLPPIDIVLVSHNHYDHMDVETLRRLGDAFRPRIFVGLGNAAYLAVKGVPAAEDLDWWNTRDIARGVTVAAVPVQHFSSRGTCDRDKTLWCGFIVSGPAGKVFFAGDTGFGPHFRQIRKRFGELRLAILPIGAYRPRWFMKPMHINPEEAVRAHEVLGAASSLGMHYGTFAQADDGYYEPIHDLEKALALREKRPAFFVKPEGQAWEVP